MDRELFKQTIEALHYAEKALNDIAQEKGLNPDQENARDLCAEAFEKHKRLFFKKKALRVNAEYAAWQEYKERGLSNFGK